MTGAIKVKRNVTFVNFKEEGLPVDKIQQNNMTVSKEQPLPATDNTLAPDPTPIAHLTTPEDTSQPISTAPIIPDSKGNPPESIPSIPIAPGHVETPVEEHSHWNWKPSKKACEILEGHAISAVKEDWEEVWCFSLEINAVECLEPRTLNEAMKRSD